MGGGQRLLEHPDHRHDAGHRGLEAQLHAVPRAPPSHSSSPCWESSCLLAVTTCLPAPHRPQHVVARRLDAADQLDDQVATLARMSSKSPARAGQHAADLRAQAGDRLDRVGALGEQLVRTPTPTVPWPSSPMRNCSVDVTGGEVLVGLAPHDDARVAVRQKITGGRGTPL